jgi:hypothetical protein
MNGLQEQVTGIVCRFEPGLLPGSFIHLPLNPDGSFTALHGPESDIELPDADPPKSITTEDLLKDEWTKKIITGL